MGEIVNGYDLIEPFQSHNAGFSRWTYARQNGRVFFLKEFMDPVYPDDETLSETLRNRRVTDCKEFEGKKRRLYEAVNCASDGNTVRICEFFRWDSRYYISNNWIESDGISMHDLSGLPMIDRMILCRSLAHSLMRLHERSVVHSDIKDTNVLLKRTMTGKLTGKLIDFDCSFLESEPPETEDDLGGDQIYLAPEACLFMCGDEAKLTCKMDVFSAGLLFHQYLAGELPYFDQTKYDYAFEAVLDDQPLIVSGALPQWIRDILQKMLECDPEARASMREVYQCFGKFFGHTSEPTSSGSMYREPSVPTGSVTKSPGGFFSQAGDL